MDDIRTRAAKRFYVTPLFWSKDQGINQTVGDVMSRHVSSVFEDATPYAAAELMVMTNVAGLPVVSHERKVVGFVTLTDMLYRLELPNIGTFAEALREAFGGKPRLDFQKFQGASVKEIMTAPAIVVTSSDTVQAAATKLLDRKIHALPVVDKERLVGIVSRRDLVSALLAWADQEAID